MSRMVLTYLEVKEKKFNKWSTLNKFINTKASYRALGISKKKDGEWQRLEFQHKNYGGQ